jgi:hypothetical protein
MDPCSTVGSHPGFAGSAWEASCRSDSAGCTVASSDHTILLGEYMIAQGVTQWPTAICSLGRHEQHRRQTRWTLDGRTNALGMRVWRDCQAVSGWGLAFSDSPASFARVPRSSGPTVPEPELQGTRSTIAFGIKWSREVRRPILIAAYRHPFSYLAKQALSTSPRSRNPWLNGPFW